MLESSKKKEGNFNDQNPSEVVSVVRCLIAVEHWEYVYTSSFFPKNQKRTVLLFPKGKWLNLSLIVNSISYVWKPDFYLLSPHLTIKGSYGEPRS